MTYGHWLNRATAALQNAERAAADGRAGGHAEAAAAVAARGRVYHRLVHLVDLLSGPVPPVSTAVADRIVNSASRVKEAGVGRVLGVGLRAASDTGAQLSGADDGDEEVVGHLREAADALGFAGDTLASHVGPPGGHARTPEGHAIVLGAGQRGALGDVAQLASGALAADRRLVGWLARGGPARTLRPVYRPMVDRLRWWTGGNYPAVLRDIARQETGESVMRLLAVAPATEQSTGPRQIGSLDDVVDVLDTARAWLRQHPSRAQHAHIVTVTRLAVTVTAAAVRHDVNGLTDARYLGQRWSSVAKALSDFAGLERGKPDAMVHDLSAAADYLRARIQPKRADPLDDHAVLPAHWRSGLSALLGKLPGLAAELDRAVATAIARGQLCIPQAQLDLSAPHRGIYYAKTQWQKATNDHEEVQALRHRLTTAASSPADGDSALQRGIGHPVAVAQLAHPFQPMLLTKDGARELRLHSELLTERLTTDRKEPDRTRRR